MSSYNSKGRLHMPLSPASTSSLTSPKGLPPNPRINPFAPLSPETEARSASDLPRIPPRFYTRYHLLQIAARVPPKGYSPPPSMTPLPAWFGEFSAQASNSKRNQLQFEDPAIASIDPPLHSRRVQAGGFGEGFGFGGGIGGRGIGRGAKPTVPRKHIESLPDPVIAQSRDPQGQMGKFSTKPNFERGQRQAEDSRIRDPADRRLKKDGGGDWRSRQAPPHRPDARYNNHRDDTGAEPAWMEDDAVTFGGDSTVPQGNGGGGGDGLVQFTPGEDMIAAHRRLNTRDVDGQWRAGKPLVSFFGGDAGSSSQQPAKPKQPKAFNAADYLLPSKASAPETTQSEPVAQAESNSVQSRFQRFFGNPGTAPATEEPAPEPSSRRFQSPPATLQTAPSYDRPATASPAIPADDRMAKLMGMLSTKSSQPVEAPSTRASSHLSGYNAPPSSSDHPMFSPHQSDPYAAPLPQQQQQPPPQPHLDPRQAYFAQQQQQQAHDFRMGPPQPPFGVAGGPPQHPPDALALLANVQQQQQRLSTHHASMPPVYGLLPDTQQYQQQHHHQQQQQQQQHQLASHQQHPQHQPPFPPPNMMPPNDLLRTLQQSQRPRAPPQPQTEQEYPAPRQQPPMGYDQGPMYPPAHFMGPPPTHQDQSVYIQNLGSPHQQQQSRGQTPAHLNTAQQDMLATLFAGLPRAN